MAIGLDHTIVPARDKVASARFFARIFGLEYNGPHSHFAPVQVNESLTLDFDERGDFEHHHYAFRISEAEFDAIFDRVKAEGIAYGSGPRSRRHADQPPAWRPRLLFRGPERPRPRSADPDRRSHKTTSSWPRGTRQSREAGPMCVRTLDRADRSSRSAQPGEVSARVPLMRPTPGGRVLAAAPGGEVALQLGIAPGLSPSAGPTARSGSRNCSGKAVMLVVMGDPDEGRGRPAPAPAMFPAAMADNPGHLVVELVGQ